MTHSPHHNLTVHLAPCLLGILILSILLGWSPVVFELLEYQQSPILNPSGTSFFDLVFDRFIDPDDRIFRDSFWLTVRTALLGATFAGALGTLLALCLVLWVKPSRLLSFLVAAPLFIPHVVAAQMMVLTLGQSGYINRILFLIGVLPDLDSAPLYLYDEFGWSIIGGFVFKETPFVALTVMPVALATLRTFGPSAQCLGASIPRVILSVMLPNIWPAAGIATLMGFAYGMVSYEIPLLLGKTHPKALAALSLESSMDPVPSGRPEAFILGLIIFGVTALIGLGFFVIQGRYRQVLLTIRQALQLKEATAAYKQNHVVAGALWSLLFLMLFPLIPLVFWTLTQSWAWPSLIPATLSWAHWQGGLGLLDGSSLSFIPPLGRSLWLATQVTLLAAGVSLPLAQWLGQSTSRGLPLLEALALSPLFMPGFMLAIGFSTLMMKYGGNLSTTSLPLVITQGIAFSPYLIFTLSAFFLTRGTLLEEAAATLGVHPLQVFLRVTFPGVLPTLLRGSLFVFLASLGDVVLTMMIQGLESPTLTLVLMPLISGGERNLAAIGCTLMILVPLGFIGFGFCLSKLFSVLKNSKLQPSEKPS